MFIQVYILNLHFEKKYHKGLSLVELLIASLVLAVVGFPIIRSITISYNISTKQHFQEQALKIGEGVLKKFLSINFDNLEDLEGKEINFNYSTKYGDKEAKIKFYNPTKGSCTVDLGNTLYYINVLVETVFEKIANPLTFYFLQKSEFLGNYKFENTSLPDFLSPPPPGYSIATYPSPDPVFIIRVNVSNNQINPLELSVFRFDLRR